MTYTKFNNYVIDHIMSTVSPNAWKVLCFVIRKTNGWQKEKDQISLNQIREGTGIRGKGTLSRAIGQLERKGYIKVVRSSDKITSNTYSLGSAKMALPKGGGSPEIALPGSAKTAHGVVPKQHTQKKDIKKEEKKHASAAKKRAPPTPAFKIFTDITGYFKINKFWRNQMAITVGEKRPDLELWGKVVKGWTGKGWFDGNVKGMLEFYERGEIPGSEKKNEENHPSQKSSKRNKGVLAG